MCSTSSPIDAFRGILVGPGLTDLLCGSEDTLVPTERLREYCISIAATITCERCERCEGVEKLHLMNKMMFAPETIGTFQRIKRAFDPDGRINEGRLIPNDRVELLRFAKANVPGEALVAP